MKILIVDDQKQLIEVYQERFELENMQAKGAQSREEAVAVLKTFSPDVILLDVYLGDQFGLDVLKELKSKLAPCPPIIIITADPEAPLLLQAMEWGADGFVEKSLSLAELVKKVKRFEPVSQMVLPPEPPTEAALVGKSAAILELSREIFRAARYQLDTLILGETGTGKNLVAETIRKLSARSKKPFVLVDCPAIVETLAEVELFGSVKDAFNNAVERDGLTQAADGGILFLNEFGDLPQNVQSKILEFLDTKKIRKVGETTFKQLDVMVIAATNRDLTMLEKEGKFRKDLLSRLMSNTIVVPTLRNRKDDIPLLVEHFIKLYNYRLNKHIETVEPEVLGFLMNHSWGSNVRELERVYIREAMINSRGNKLTLDDFKTSHLSPVTNPKNTNQNFYLNLPYQQAKTTCMADFHKNYITHYLKKYNDKQSAAAEAMGETRQSLNNLIKKYGIKLDKQ